MIETKRKDFPSSNRYKRLAEIDVLRGLAALAVVVFHYSTYCQRYFQYFPFSFEVGRYGVQLFFVISGFFIYSTLERCANAKEFLLLRFSRLYPAYWITLLVVLIAEKIQSSKVIWWSGYAVNATMLQSFVGFPNIDEVYWTLGVEMSFYLMMALFLATGLIRHPIRVTLVWLGIANVWFVVHGSPSPIATKLEVVARILSYAPFFVLGMMFHLVKKSQGRIVMYPAMVILFSLLTAWFTGGGVIGIVASISTLLFALALSGKLRMLVSPVTLWLGSISYSVYLVHRNLGYAALAKLNASGFDSRFAFILVLAGALLIASALTYWIERPFLRLFREKVKKYFSTNLASR